VAVGLLDPVASFVAVGGVGKGGGVLLIGNCVDCDKPPLTTPRLCCCCELVKLLAVLLGLEFPKGAEGVLRGVVGADTDMCPGELGELPFFCAGEFVFKLNLDFSSLKPFSGCCLPECVSPAISPSNSLTAIASLSMAGLLWGKV